MNDMNDNRWLTVAEAASVFGVSERTLQRWIKQDKVVSKLEKGRRLLLASSVAKAGAIVSGVSPSVSEVLQAENYELKGKIASLEEEAQRQTDKHRQEMAKLSEDLQEAEKRGALADELSQDKVRLQEQIENLQKQLSDASHRHDTVVMQMSRMLEYERQPFWRRWFKHKALPAPENVVNVEPGVAEVKSQDG